MGKRSRFGDLEYDWVVCGAFFNGMNEQCILRNSQYISLVYFDQDEKQFPSSFAWVQKNIRLISLINMLVSHAQTHVQTYPITRDGLKKDKNARYTNTLPLNMLSL